MINSWKVEYETYNPESELLREALCALGNGYLVTRGAAEESQAGSFHYPGTYLSGGYNRLETDIAGSVIENEDLVNWPNWLVLKFKFENGDWFNPEQSTLLNYKQELDVKEGILIRTIRFEDDHERRTELISRRVVSMADPHIAAIQWKIKPENWSGKITVHAALDGTVKNSGVARYRELNNDHLRILDSGKFEEDYVYLNVKTSQSEVIMSQAARCDVYFDSPDLEITRSIVKRQPYVAQELEFNVEENKTVTIEKIVAIYTSRDSAIADPELEAKTAVRRADNFEKLKEAHAGAWSFIWERCDTILVDGDDRDQLLLRLHIFHLFQTCSLHTIDLDVGVPARGWHGEAYRGHILWDELFIFPFLNINLPELTRSLLMYRYRRLGEARYASKQAGYEGAMFPWQSGSNGREESQKIHLNPESGRWIPDNSQLQRHVNAAIAYNVWRYYQITGDLEFLSFYGAEMMLDIAKFWASKATYNDDKKRFELLQVVGPDEYHTTYPEAEAQGLNNNAYTNIMVVWTLIHAFKVMEKLDKRRVDELMSKLNVSREDLARWNNISHKMYVPFIKEGKIIEQFEGFDKLKDLDWDRYHEQYGDILRLDRILEKEQDSVDNYKAVKQADVLMLFYLFSAEELKELFNHIGYDFDPVYIPLNISYYQPVTSHGSTLSKLVYSWVLARSNREKSWHDFNKALISDFEDIQGGTTSEGIHLGAMAGAVDLVQRCYTGLEFRNEELHFNPQLPEKVNRIAFRMRYRNHDLEIDLTKKNLCLKSRGGWDHTVIVVKDRKYRLKKGQEKNFKYTSRKRKIRKKYSVSME